MCYLGLDDPLVHTQVIAYLEGLAARGHVVHLLTFEKTRLSRAVRRRWRTEFKRRGIVWHGLRYHKRPSLPATVCDVVCGTVYAAFLVRRHRLDAVHARSHVPAAMALLARRLVRFDLVFDIRGLMAEEFEDAGRWRRGGAPFRLTKWIERLAIARAAGIVVLTDRVRHQLFGGATDHRVHVIPCCVDVERIAALRGERHELRRRLGVGERPMLVYVGKLTGWYMEREMAEFFAAARRLVPELHFLILTQMDPSPIRDELTRLGIPPQAQTITRCAPDMVGGYLAAADVAISFIRPSFSKISTSPTKVGEYLAAGLPIVCGAGIGDVDELLREYGIGVVVETFATPELERAAGELLTLIADTGHADRSRRAARERLSLAGVGIPAYDALYADVAANAGRPGS